MKILLINKYYYKKGGTETYTFGLKKMLENHGHEVCVFSMDDEKNISSEYSDYFVDNIDFSKDKIKNAFKLIYSREAYNKLEKLIKEYEPDLCHVNLIYHHITPSIFHVLSKYNIPVIFTAHDYKIICPNYKIWNKNRCKKCKNGKFINCVLNKCHKDSYLNSFLMTVEAYIHKIIKSYEKIDYIIAPSSFMKNTLVDFGINESKITVIPNFIDTYMEKNNNKENKIGDYILYFGRLSEEKGIHTFVKSKKYIHNNISYKIVGTGPMEEEILKEINKENLENIELKGFLDGEELIESIKNSLCVVIPSEWDEVFGLTVIESFINKKVVITSKQGAFPELIDEDFNGNMFNTGDEKDLADKINRIIEKNPEELKQMQEKSYLHAKEKYNQESYYNQLMCIYEAAIKNKTT